VFIDSTAQQKSISDLIHKYGESCRLRAERGVRQAAALWIESDGSAEDFVQFCDAFFIGDDNAWHETFLRLDRTFESIDGHFTAMELDLREPLDLDTGDIKPVEMLLGEYSPSAHLTDDF
jgi:hypothetical protein